MAITNSFLASSSSSSSNSVKDWTFNGVANMIKHLPTGTVFLYMYLNPVVTNNGHCQTVNKYLSGILTALCGLSCCFACFTDSYTDSNGKTHYGIATCKGLWPSSDSGVDLSIYKLKVGDFVHALFSLLVFAVLSLLDTNTVRCFYPSFETSEEMLLKVLPPVMGVISGTVFMVFPNNRHGIGYPSSSDSSKDSSK